MRKFWLTFICFLFILLFIPSEVFSNLNSSSEFGSASNEIATISFSETTFLTDISTSLNINDSSLTADVGKDTTIGACVTQYVLNGTATGLTDNLEYSWYPSEFLENSQSATPVFNTKPGMEVTFMLVVKSTVGNFVAYDSAYVAVNVATEPIASAGNDIWLNNETLDNNKEIVLDGSASVGAKPLIFKWWVYNDDNTIIILSDSAECIVSQSNSYYLTVTDRYGCSDTDRVNISYPITPYVAIDDYVETSQQTPVDIYILRNDSIDDEDDYNLELLAILENPKHGVLTIHPYDSLVTYRPDMYYYGLDTFRYVGTTKFNTDDATVVINVHQKPPVLYEAFSPNGDGKNDYYIIPNIELYSENKLTIFNRYGSVVYQASPYTNASPWDGSNMSGSPLPEGTYLYYLDLKTGDQLKGAIFIKK